MSIHFKKLTSVILAILLIDPNIGMLYSDSPSSVDWSIYEIDVWVSVESQYTASEGVNILLVRDLHADEEAQLNIAKMLYEVSRRSQKPLTVFSEGATGPVDVSFFGRFPDADIRRDVTREFVAQGWLTGPEYLAISRFEKKPIQIWGIEKPQLYFENFKQFRHVMSEIEETEMWFTDLEETLNQLKKSIYPEKLYQLDQMMIAREEGQVNLETYVKYVKDEVDFLQYSNFKKFLEIIEQKENLEADKADREKEKLLRFLGKSLDKNDLSKLIQQGLAYRLGKLQLITYLESIEKFSVKSGIAIESEYPHFTRLIEMIRVQTEIDIGGLIRELDQIDEFLIEKYVEEGEIKTLVQLDQYQEILGKMLSLKMSRQDLQFLEKNQDRIEPKTLIQNFVQLIQENHLTVPEIFLESTVVTELQELQNLAIQFYKTAKLRDEAIVSEMLKHLDSSGESQAVLVAGGFHTDGIKRLLDDKNINYCVVTPRVTHSPDESIYLSRMMDDRFEYHAIAFPSLFNQLIDVLGPSVKGPLWQELARAFMRGILDKSGIHDRKELRGHLDRWVQSLPEMNERQEAIINAMRSELEGEKIAGELTREQIREFIEAGSLQAEITLELLRRFYPERLEEIKFAEKLQRSIYFSKSIESRTQPRQKVMRGHQYQKISDDEYRAIRSRLSLQFQDAPKPIYRDEAGKLFVLKERREFKLVHPLAYRWKNDLKRELLASFIGRSRVNTTETRRVRVSEVSEIDELRELTDEALENYYLSRLVLDMEPAELIYQDARRARSAQLVFEVLIRKWDSHYLNTGYVGEVPVTFDHDVAFNPIFANGEEGLSQFISLFSGHLSGETLSRDLRLGRKERIDAYLNMDGYDLGQISKSIWEFKNIDFRSLIEESGYENEELESIVALLEATAQSLTEDVEKTISYLTRIQGVRIEPYQEPIDKFDKAAQRAMVDELADPNKHRVPVQNNVPVIRLSLADLDEERLTLTVAGIRARLNDEVNIGIIELRFQNANELDRVLKDEQLRRQIELLRDDEQINFILVLKSADLKNEIVRENYELLHRLGIIIAPIADLDSFTEKEEDDFGQFEIPIIEPDERRYRDASGEDVEEIIGLKEQYEIETSTGRKIFIVDDHHHVVRHWVRSYREGLIGKNAKILHVDAHADDLIRPREFKYLIDLDEDGLDEVDTNVDTYFDIESFITPMVASGLIDPSQWYFLNGLSQSVFRHQLHWRPLPKGSSASPFQFDYGTELHPLSEVSKDLDIVDIDVDVFEPLFKRLKFGFESLTVSASQAEEMAKQEILSKWVPELAKVASKAKIVSIATSPNFIDQAFAIEITQALLEKLNRVDSEQEPDLPDDLTEFVSAYMSESRAKAEAVLRDVPDELWSNVIPISFEEVERITADWPQPESRNPYEKLFDLVNETNPRALVYWKLEQAFRNETLRKKEAFQLLMRLSKNDGLPNYEKVALNHFIEQFRDTFPVELLPEEKPEDGFIGKPISDDIDETRKERVPDVQERVQAQTASIPLLGRLLISIGIVAGFGTLMFSLGLLNPAVGPVLAGLIGLSIFGSFMVLTDILGQWMSGTGIEKKQVFWMMFLGPLMGLVSWAGFSLMNIIIPADTALPYLLVATIRIIGAMGVVRIRTLMYAWMVGKTRGQLSNKKSQASLAQEKQFESFWMTRGPSYFRNYVIHMLLPPAAAVAVDGISTQFFALFYSWSVSKEGFIIKSERFRKSRVYLILAPIFLPFVWMYKKLFTPLKDDEVQDVEEVDDKEIDHEILSAFEETLDEIEEALSEWEIEEKNWDNLKTEELFEIWNIWLETQQRRFIAWGRGKVIPNSNTSAALEPLISRFLESVNRTVLIFERHKVDARTSLGLAHIQAAHFYHFLRGNTDLAVDLYDYATDEQRNRFFENPIFREIRRAWENRETQIDPILDTEEPRRVLIGQLVDSLREDLLTPRYFHANQERDMDRIIEWSMRRNGWSTDDPDFIYEQLQSLSTRLEDGSADAMDLELEYPNMWEYFFWPSTELRQRIEIYLQALDLNSNELADLEAEVLKAPLILEYHFEEVGSSPAKVVSLSIDEGMTGEYFSRLYMNGLPRDLAQAINQQFSLENERVSIGLGIRELNVQAAHFSVWETLLRGMARRGSLDIEKLRELRGVLLGFGRNNDTAVEIDQIIPRIQDFITNYGAALDDARQALDAGDTAPDLQGGAMGMGDPGIKVERYGGKVTRLTEMLMDFQEGTLDDSILALKKQLVQLQGHMVRDREGKAYTIEISTDSREMAKAFVENEFRVERDEPITEGLEAEEARHLRERIIPSLSEGPMVLLRLRDDSGSLVQGGFMFLQVRENRIHVDNARFLSVQGQGLVGAVFEILGGQLSKIQDGSVEVTLDVEEYHSLLRIGRWLLEGRSDDFLELAELRAIIEKMPDDGIPSHAGRQEAVSEMEGAIGSVLRSEKKEIPAEVIQETLWGKLMKRMGVENLRIFLSPIQRGMDHIRMSGLLASIKGKIPDGLVRPGKISERDVEAVDERRPEGGFISQGIRSRNEFNDREENIRENDISEEYHVKLADLLKNAIRRNESWIEENGLLEQVGQILVALESDEYKIYGYEGIVKGPDDFFLGLHNMGSKEIFLPINLIEDLIARGPPSLADEYLLHELLDPILGHYQSVFVQQGLFPNHFSEGVFSFLDGLKYLVSYMGDPTKPFKGILGEALRDWINDQIAVSEVAQDVVFRKGVLIKDGIMRQIGDRYYDTGKRFRVQFAEADLLVKEQEERMEVDLFFEDMPHDKLGHTPWSEEMVQGYFERLRGHGASFEGKQMILVGPGPSLVEINSLLRHASGLDKLIVIEPNLTHASSLAEDIMSLPLEVRSKIEIYRTPIEQLDLPEASIDFVYSRGVLWEDMVEADFVDLDEAWKKIHDVLVPDGYFFGSAHPPVSGMTRENFKLLEVDRSDEPVELKILKKSLRNEALSTIFRHQDGIAVAPTLFTLSEIGVMDLFEEDQEVTIEDIVERFAGNDGYIGIALNILVAQGWLNAREDKGNVYYSITKWGQIAVEYAQNYKELIDFIPFAIRMDDYLFGDFRAPPDMEEDIFDALIEKAKRGWDLPEETDPQRRAVREQVRRHLDGMLVGPSVAALGMRKVFQGVVDFLDFLKLGIGNDELWDHLVKSGYVKEDGKILNDFIVLTDSSGLNLPAEYENERERIYEVLKFGLIEKEIWDHLIENEYITEKGHLTAKFKSLESIDQFEFDKIIIEYRNDMMGLMSLTHEGRTAYSVRDEDVEKSIEIIFDVLKKVQYGRFDPQTHEADISWMNGNTGQLEESFDLMETIGWATREGSKVTLTPLGVEAFKRPAAYGVTVSYLPTFKLVPQLLFGDPSGFPPMRDEDGNETWVNRVMNVWGSGGAHKTYFEKIDEIIIEIFNRPFEEQPKGIEDMGSGDGAFLKHLYHIVMTKTKRGELIRQDPEKYGLLMVGADFNEESRIETAKTLREAGIPHITEFGDVNDPAGLARLLKEKHGINIEDFLNVRSFLDHNRPYADPTVLARHRPTQSIRSYARTGGVRIPNTDLQQNLVEHFRAWAPFVGKHGLLVIELHGLDPRKTATRMGKSLGTPYDGTHGYSNQYTVELETFHAAAREAGLTSREEYAVKFPKNEFATISIDYFTSSFAQDEVLASPVNHGTQIPKDRFTIPGTDATTNLVDLVYRSFRHLMEEEFPIVIEARGDMSYLRSPLALEWEMADDVDFVVQVPRTIHEHSIFQDALYEAFNVELSSIGMTLKDYHWNPSIEGSKVALIQMHIETQDGYEKEVQIRVVQQELAQKEPVELGGANILGTYYANTLGARQLEENLYSVQSFERFMIWYEKKVSEVSVGVIFSEESVIDEAIRKKGIIKILKTMIHLSYILGDEDRHQRLYGYLTNILRSDDWVLTDIQSMIEEEVQYFKGLPLGTARRYILVRNQLLGKNAAFDEAALQYFDRSDAALNLELRLFEWAKISTHAKLKPRNKFAAQLLLEQRYGSSPWWVRGNRPKWDEPIHEMARRTVTTIDGDKLKRGGLRPEDIFPISSLGSAMASDQLSNLDQRLLFGHLLSLDPNPDGSFGVLGYEFVDVIAFGRQGVVFKVRDKRGQFHAIKVSISEDVSENKSARRLAKLQKQGQGHPNLLKIRHQARVIGRDGIMRGAILSEYVDIREQIDHKASVHVKSFRYSSRDIFRVIDQSFRGLSYLVDYGIALADPNIFITGEGKNLRAVIADFEFSKVYNSASDLLEDERSFKIVQREWTEMAVKMMELIQLKLRDDGDQLSSDEISAYINAIKIHESELSTPARQLMRPLFQTLRVFLYAMDEKYILAQNELELLENHEFLDFNERDFPLFHKMRKKINANSEPVNEIVDKIVAEIDSELSRSNPLVLVEQVADNMTSLYPELVEEAAVGLRQEVIFEVLRVISERAVKVQTITEKSLEILVEKGLPREVIDVLYQIEGTSLFYAILDQYAQEDDLYSDPEIQNFLVDLYTSFIFSYQLTEDERRGLSDHIGEAALEAFADQYESAPTVLEMVSAYVRAILFQEDISFFEDLSENLEELFIARNLDLLFLTGVDPPDRAQHLQNITEYLGQLAGQKIKSLDRLLGIHMPSPQPTRFRSPNATESERQLDTSA